MEPSPSEPIFARVADLRVCTAPNCPFTPSPHLSVHLHDVPLARGNATALSYVWGEFNRGPITVGHAATSATRTFSLEIGTEWVVSDLLNRLVELCAERPVWMDQFCIPQKEDEIVRTLASIPTIYRTFDVVVLMPGAPCGCLREHMRDLAGVDLANFEPDMMRVLMPSRQRMLSCFNSIAPSSWMGRMWPRQELMYAEQVRCVWVGREESACVRAKDENRDMSKLAPFLYWFYTTLVEGGCPERIALRRMELLVLQVELENTAEMKKYVEGFTPPSMKNIDSYFRFLSGETVRKGGVLPSNNDGSPEGQGVGRFFYDMGQLSAGRLGPYRRATRSRDYVISVWTSCPGYVIPSGYKTMTTADLFQDAIDQLCVNHGVMLATSAPQGLFEDTRTGSALWKPAYYLSSMTVHNASMVYSAIGHKGIHSNIGPSQEIYLKNLNVENLPLSAGAKDWQALIKDIPENPSGKALVDLFHSIIKHWGDEKTAGAFRMIDEQYYNHAFIYIQQVKDGQGIPKISAAQSRRLALLHMLFEKNNHMKKFDWGPVGFDRTSVGPDELYHFMHQILSSALGLDMGVCWNEGIKLMFSATDGGGDRPPRIGFFRKDVDLDAISKRAAEGRGQEVLTVRVGDETFHESLLFEAQRVPKEGSLPAYQVFGIWAPTNLTAKEDYGALDFGSGTDKGTEFEAILC
ncbi:hypothetical protein BFW01_g1277 [Lasiodiplodia theobromae]|uniref:Heterokaryon incompatibility domain-containing protein n=1 Tax=Lasiodiplodia theobromae TaxID=45133 RepID=A0A8H7ISX0_9PEZI|nr:hypothetical protein BFW01_g1277 [Lasiodiplodia theobromae]